MKAHILYQVSQAVMEPEVTDFTVRDSIPSATSEANKYYLFFVKK